MRRFVFVLLILGLFFGISSCAGSVTGQARSTFYATFSLGEIVAGQEQFLLPKALSLSGTEAGPTAPPYQKHEEMIVQIDPANKSKFIEAVKADTQQAILDSGARIEGQGGSFQELTGGPIDYISFRYSQGEASGIINLYGVVGEGTNYIITLIITEN